MKIYIYKRYKIEVLECNYLILKCINVMISTLKSIVLLESHSRFYPFKKHLLKIDFFFFGVLISD